MQQAPLQNLGIDTSYGVANEEDVEQVDSLTGQKKSGGILDLIMSIAVPGYGFLKNMVLKIFSFNYFKSLPIIKFQKETKIKPY